MLSLQLPLQLGFAARFSSSAGQQAAAEKQPAQQQGAKKEVSGPLEPAPPRQQGVFVPAADVTPCAGCFVPQAFDSLELTEEKINAITDQIPQKPVTVVEGTSYMVVIIAAFTVRGPHLAAGSRARRAAVLPAWRTCPPHACCC